MRAEGKEHIWLACSIPIFHLMTRGAGRVPRRAPSSFLSSPVSADRCHHLKILPFRNPYCISTSACSLEDWANIQEKNVIAQAEINGLGLFLHLGWLRCCSRSELIGTEQGKQRIPFGCIPLFISHNLRDKKLEALPASLSQDHNWCHSNSVSLASKNPRMQIKPEPN